MNNNRFRFRLPDPTAAILVVLCGLFVGCDAIRTREARRERASAGYRAAMAEISAGRVDAAVKGLEKVVADDPANASARFQLATLMQDHRHDYLEAIRHYREYRMLSPKSDKVDLSVRREAMCERQLAPVLAKKMKLLDIAAVQAELTAERAARVKAEAESDRLSRSLEEAETALLSARRENKKIVSLVKTLDADAPVERPPEPVNEKDLLDYGDENFDHAKLAADISVLASEESAETTTMPFKQVVKTNAVAKVEKKPIEHPDTYVVQEGDTLYKLAIRFYGVRSAWQRIREANKATISTDGRIRTGQTLKLP